MGVIPRAGVTLPVSRVTRLLAPDIFGVGIVVDKEETEEVAVGETI